MKFAFTLRSGGRVRQLTHDHGLVQELFDAGAISAAEAAEHPSANIITRAVGAESLDVDNVTNRLCAGDRFLCAATVCSGDCPKATLPTYWSRARTMTPGRQRSIARPTTTSPQ